MKVMSKRKSFKESNPAAAFISTPKVKEEKKEYADVDVDKDTKLDIDRITDKNTDTNKGKIIKKTPPRKIIQSQKTDIDKEADKEIYTDSAVAIQDCQVTMEVVPPKIIYRPKELKSKKVMILTKPSTHKALQKIASKRYTSVNDIINTLLEGFIASES